MRMNFLKECHPPRGDLIWRKMLKNEVVCQSFEIVGQNQNPHDQEEGAAGDFNLPKMSLDPFKEFYKSFNPYRRRNEGDAQSE